jgi:betaine-homocysteine S-methyltransferase
VEALTYYAHRDKLRVIGKEHLLEDLNKKALAIAKEVVLQSEYEHEGRKRRPLFAGNISNSNMMIPSSSPDHGKVVEEVRKMFEEQVKWAVEAGVDFIIGETYSWHEEAMMAVEVVKKVGLPVVITLAIPNDHKTRDGVLLEDSMKQLEAAGADVVGLNCGYGPKTIAPLLKRIKGAVKVPIAALPSPYRTTDAQQTFFQLTDSHYCPYEGYRSFPVALDPFTCTRYEVADFAKEAHEIGVQYVGLCCGAGPHHIRAVAEALGRKPPASKYSPDMSKHFAFGTDAKLKARDYYSGTTKIL